MPKLKKLKQKNLINSFYFDIYLFLHLLICCYSVAFSPILTIFIFSFARINTVKVVFLYISKT